MLRDIPLDKSFNLDAVVRRTDGLSGSDLKEACRSMCPMQPSPLITLMQLPRCRDDTCSRIHPSQQAVSERCRSRFCQAEWRQATCVTELRLYGFGRRGACKSWHGDVRKPRLEFGTGRTDWADSSSTSYIDPICIQVAFEVVLLLSHLVGFSNANPDCWPHLSCI